MYFIAPENVNSSQYDVTLKNLNIKKQSKVIQTLLMSNVPTDEKQDTKLNCFTGFNSLYLMFYMLFMYSSVHNILCKIFRNTEDKMHTKASQKISRQCDHELYIKKWT